MAEASFCSSTLAGKKNDIMLLFFLFVFINFQVLISDKESLWINVKKYVQWASCSASYISSSTHTIATALLLLVTYLVVN